MSPSAAFLRKLGLKSNCRQSNSLSQHGGEKNLLKCAWAPDGEMVSAGSSDQAVHIWDEPSTQELYFLPGHTGSVNEVSFTRVWDTKFPGLPTFWRRECEQGSSEVGESRSGAFNGSCGAWLRLTGRCCCSRSCLVACCGSLGGSALEEAGLSYR